MNWTKENLGKIYLEKFGITLSSEELDYHWGLVSTKTITPQGDKMNIALSPWWITEHLEREMRRTGSTLDSPRFKKVNEEILPAVHYALFLKKIGLGEHLICSSDSPDIVLINKDNNKVEGNAYKKKAFPVEVTFVTDHAVGGVNGNDAAEKIAKVIEINKLNNSYSSNVALLVVIDTVFDNLDLKKLQSLIKDKAKNFNSVELLVTENEDNIVIASIYPELATQDLSLSKDLLPLMY